jgi:hypothetical protein
LALDFSILFLNILNVIVTLPLAYYTARIGNRIGFSFPWQLISGGFILSAIGGIVRIFGGETRASPFPNLLDMGMFINIIADLLVLVGFIYVYILVKKPAGKC